MLTFREWFEWRFSEAEQGAFSPLALETLEEAYTAGKRAIQRNRCPECRGVKRREEKRCADCRDHLRASLGGKKVRRRKIASDGPIRTAGEAPPPKPAGWNNRETVQQTWARIIPDRSKLPEAEVVTHGGWKRA